MTILAITLPGYQSIMLAMQYFSSYQLYARPVKLTGPVKADCTADPVSTMPWWQSFAINMDYGPARALWARR